MPLRGKVLNAEQASLQKVLGNKELQDVVSALGCGVGPELKVDKLRYHKIIFLMDADSDGHHIATLLLTFFYRHLQPLIANGFVYLAQPPLFRIDHGKETYTLDPASRRLLRVTVKDGAETDRILTELMGKDVEARLSSSWSARSRQRWTCRTAYFRKRSSAEPKPLALASARTSSEV